MKAKWFSTVLIVMLLAVGVVPGAALRAVVETLRF